MRRLIEWQTAQGDRNPRSAETPIFAPAARFSLLLDAIKLIGTGNGAGVLASVAALYYFASRPELHLPVKLAAVFFGVGLLVFAISVTSKSLRQAARPFSSGYFGSVNWACANESYGDREIIFGSSQAVLQHNRSLDFGIERPKPAAVIGHAPPEIVNIPV
jgi:hypothetical protein